MRFGESGPERACFGPEHANRSHEIRARMPATGALLRALASGQRMLSLVELAERVILKSNGL
jgi:hypothetical protein